jgi:hypothetical protein
MEEIKVLSLHQRIKTEVVKGRTYGECIDGKNSFESF